MISLTIASEAVAAQVILPQDLYQRVLPSVLTLKILNAQGERFTASGFFALREGIAVTAWHSVHDARHVYAILADGTRVEVEGLVDRAELHDLALIRVAASGRPLANLGAQKPVIGSRLYVIGAPKGFAFSIADGLLSQTREVDGAEQYQISCPLSTGNSGGPVLDAHGNVIGVAAWSKVDAQNVNFAVPVEYLQALDPAKPITPWSRLDSHPVQGASGLKLEVSPESDGDLAALRGYLKRSAGKRITVIVQDAEENRNFSFVVPE